MLEAAVAGVPTVGTTVGHIADFWPEAAVAVPVADSAALADALFRLAGCEEQRLRLASASQARALTINADFTAHRFAELYEEVAASNSGMFTS